MSHPHERRQRVDVDQAALMSKILTRYNTEFGVLRELLQNSDDAAAEHACIALHTAAADSSSVERIVVSNSGREFTDADWQRVTKIAAGNPDASSVGLFGVGFYSVFSCSDTPEIVSGGKAMRFALEHEEYCTYVRNVDTFVRGATVVCPLRHGSDARHWADADELSKQVEELARLH